MNLEHVSLFSGVGGIDKAMHGAGIHTRAVCEIDRAAQGVLTDQFPDAHLYTDVKEVTGDGLRTLGLHPSRTIVSAGFPCTDLSVAGGRRGMGHGTRSGLYWEVDRILGEFTPAWVVLENVPGLLSAACACPGDGTCVDRGVTVRCDGELHPVPGGACWGRCIARHGGVMGAVLGSLAERGYGFAYRVLDARHFGVPQRRRRVVIVGRLGDDGRAPAQVLLEPEGVRGDLAAGITPRPRTAARAARGDGSGSGAFVNAVSTLTVTAGGWRLGAEEAAGGQIVGTFQKVIRSGARDANGDLPPEVWAARDVAATLNLNDLGSESRAVDLVVNPDGVRRLTPLECERLQGFPDNHTATSNGRPQADNQRYRQMGNAVAVPVFEWVARRIAAIDNTLGAAA